MLGPRPWVMAVHLAYIKQNVGIDENNMELLLTSAVRYSRMAAE